MLDISSLLESHGSSVIRLEVSSEDLYAFSQELIAQAKSELSTSKESPQQMRMLTRQETMERLKVTGTTLWNWERKGFLMPVHMGNKNLYREADIEKLLGTNSNEFNQ